MTTSLNKYNVPAGLRLLLLFAVLFALIVMAGCVATPSKSAEITAQALAKPTIKYVVVKPGEILLSDCVVTGQPPNREDYVKMTADQREIALASYARGLQGDFGKCAQKPKDFRAFIDEQTKVYEDKK